MFHVQKRLGLVLLEFEGFCQYLRYGKRRGRRSGWAVYGLGAWNGGVVGLFDRDWLKKLWRVCERRLCRGSSSYEMREIEKRREERK